MCRLPENTIFPMMCLMRPLGSHTYKYDSELVRSMKSPTNCFSVNLSPCRVFFSGTAKVK